jgi:hypothetical protein
VARLKDEELEQEEETMVPVPGLYDEEEREDGEGETVTRDAFHRDLHKGSRPLSTE